ncbi:MAG: type II toxin-antitoxin system HicB family antitoxin [Reyranella sp.]|nr:type II toxin-antitoxin system HicB family antitoxin [Reyranella sp.]
MDTALDGDMPVSAPSTLEAARKLPGYKGWAVGLVDLEDSFFDDTVERVNITLPRRMLWRLDDMARTVGQSRSGLIARLTVASSAKADGPPPRRPFLKRHLVGRGWKSRRYLTG